MEALIDIKKIYYKLRQEIAEYWELDEIGIDFPEECYIEIAKKSHLKNELEIMFQKLGVEY